VLYAVCCMCFFEVNPQTRVYMQIQILIHTSTYTQTNIHNNQQSRYNYYHTFYMWARANVIHTPEWEFRQLQFEDAQTICNYKLCTMYPSPVVGTSPGCTFDLVRISTRTYNVQVLFSRLMHHFIMLYFASSRIRWIGSLFYFIVNCVTHSFKYLLTTYNLTDLTLIIALNNHITYAIQTSNVKPKCSVGVLVSC